MGDVRGSTDEVTVIGAGPSGLGAAFRLQQAGYRVRLLEVADKVGGRFTTLHRDGFIMDQGAQVIPSKHLRLLSIIEEAGMSDELVPGGTMLAFAREDGLNYLDTDHLLRDGLRLGQVSGRAKLALTKLAVDVIRAHRALSFEDLEAVAALDTESAGNYARRRLGTECYEYVIDAAMRGMLATPSDTISKVDLFYGLSKFIGVSFLALRNGNGSYGDTLARRFDVELGAMVHEVTDRGDRAAIRWTDASGMEHDEEAAGCVLAVPAPAAAAMHAGLDDWRRAFLGRVSYTTSVSVSAALSRPPRDVPASLIFLPRRVHDGLIGMVLDHNKAPGRAPAGKGLVSGYAITDWARELIDEDDQTISKHMLAAYDAILPGVSDDVEFTVVGRWRPTAMFGHPGYYREYRRFDELAALDGRVQLAGDYFMTSNVDTATRNGEVAARRLLRALGR
ncbi:MAG TPA: NAD(P)/FAD-dependent oxidoreductase [Acidimicrobiales bacterium]